MRRISYATLELPEDTLVILSFHFLFMRKPTPACPLLASEWYSRWPLWKVVKLSSFLRTSPIPITSHFMLFSFSSSSSSCTCSSFSNVLTLYVAIFSRSPLVWWFFLKQWIVITQLVHYESYGTTPIVVYESSRMIRKIYRIGCHVDIWLSLENEQNIVFYFVFLINTHTRHVCMVHCVISSGF